MAALEPLSTEPTNMALQSGPPALPTVEQVTRRRKRKTRKRATEDSDDELEMDGRDIMPAFAASNRVCDECGELGGGSPATFVFYYTKEVFDDQSAFSRRVTALKTRQKKERRQSGKSTKICEVCPTTGRIFWLPEQQDELDQWNNNGLQDFLSGI